MALNQDEFLSLIKAVVKDKYPTWDVGIYLPLDKAVWVVKATNGFSYVVETVTKMDLMCAEPEMFPLAAQVATGLILSIDDWILAHPDSYHPSGQYKGHSTMLIKEFYGTGSPVATNSTTTAPYKFSLEAVDIGTSFYSTTNKAARTSIDSIDELYEIMEEK